MILWKILTRSNQTILRTKTSGRQHLFGVVQYETLSTTRYLMFGLGPFELILVGIVAILLFGSKLPEVARSLGQSYNQFRRGLTDLQDQFKISDFTAPPAGSSPKSLEDYDEPELAEPVAPKFTPPPSSSSKAEDSV